MGCARSPRDERAAFVRIYGIPLIGRCIAAQRRRW
jgi:hypothetical protein